MNLNSSYGKSIRDIIVFHLRKKDQVLLVFPTGAKINDTTGILEGKYTDGRRMVTIKSEEDLETKKEILQRIISQHVILAKHNTLD